MAMMSFTSTPFLPFQEAPALDVGERLQAIRKLKGLSQRELAKRAGVTNST
ncbi:helix-turn-helix domain-containing protein, partial [Mycobacterium tuberculosis]|nr:helix-turn-helix domain-containing protein [Mycobacterium tuberculosis]